MEEIGASVATPGPGESEGVGMVRRPWRGMGQVTFIRRSAEGLARAAERS